MKNFRIAITALSIAAFGSLASAGIAVDLTASGQGFGSAQNAGSSWSVLDTGGGPTNLTLSARSVINPMQPFVLGAPGEAGTVYFLDNGAGVQNVKGRGSKEISGSGGHENEELILSFNPASPGSSVVIEFAEWDAGTGLGDEGDPVVWVLFNNGSTSVFNETTFGSALSTMGGSATLSLAGLGFGAADQINQVIVREVNKHTIVSGIGFNAIPTPGSMTLIAGAGLMASRRRRK